VACYKPLTAWKPLDGGRIVFRELANHREITLPCGQCIGCRAERREGWAFRCWAESQLHEYSSFITLTYDNDHLPENHSLSHADWQLFAKRLRKRIGPFRFFMCGEYGENTLRPHYHALIFGPAFADRVRSNSVRSKHLVYHSPAIAAAWGKGHHSLGDFTFATARYCASYVCKTLNGELAERTYSFVDPSTGEIHQRKPEYAKMSLRPGIGRDWFTKYWPEVYTHGAVHLGQHKLKIPAYFDSLFESLHPDEFTDSKLGRTQKAIKHLENSTRERLAVREQLHYAKAKFNKSRQSHDL